MIKECCGTCYWWDPPVIQQVSHSEHRAEDPFCRLLQSEKEAYCLPESWCWKKATDDQLASRVKAEILKPEEVIDCA